MNLFKKQEKTHSARGHINYTWILKHLSFLMFLALLAIIYIANGHWADNTMRDINTTTRQVKNMEYEYKNLKSLEMYRSRESQVTQAASALGLKPAADPPVKLEVERSKTQNRKTTNN
ncbi:MAG: FtsL-like putative cell division protein [Parafilimonas sp.]